MQMRDDVHLTNLLVIGIDVTESINTEEIFLSRTMELETANALLKKNKSTLSEAQRLAGIGSWEFDLIKNELLWSDEIFRIFEVDKEEFAVSYEAFLNAIHPDDREMVDKTYKNSLINREPYRITHRLLMRDGRVKWVEERCKSDFDPNGIALRSSGTVQDITERKLTEEKIRIALGEKEVLLKEVHHRVKNNLQIITSLLYLQEQKIKDEEHLEIFRESANRINSMAMIHEQLYQTSDFEKVNFYEYTKSLTESLFQSYGIDNSRISLKIDIEGTTLDVNTAIPCGLIMNEIVSNSLKHAFPDERIGMIEIKLHYDDDQYCLDISDDGIGMSSSANNYRPGSLGLRLIERLVGQINGSLYISGPPGTKYRILFHPQK